MSRKLTAILAIVGLLLFTASSVAPHIPAVQHWQRNDVQSGVAFFALLFGELIGVALMLAAYTGALVKVSRLEQNRWLWAMGIGVGLAITGYGAIVTLLMLLAYIAFGPTKPAIHSASKNASQSTAQSMGQSAEVSPSDVEE